MTTPEVSAFLPVARQLVLQAGRRVMDIRKGPLLTGRKTDRSLVTNADHAADQILREGLQKSFPDHAVLTEETGLAGGKNSDYVWVIDPLDGTRAYAKNIPGFCIMAGLLCRNEPVLGVVYDPLEERLYQAIRGGGCFQTHNNRRQRMKVSGENQWNCMTLVVSRGFPPPLKKFLNEFLPVSWLEPVNSVGIKVGLLLCRQADLYINHHPVHFWDTCAPSLLLQEAGGRMTLWDGSALTYSLQNGHCHTQPTVATNNQRHQELVEILRKAP